MTNERNAGRKRTLTNEQLREVYERRKAGESVTSLAKEYDVSRQTMSAYIHFMMEDELVIEIGSSDVDSKLYRLKKYWEKLNAIFVEQKVLDADEVGECNLRLDFMNKDRCITSILVDLRREKVHIVNESDDILHRAFGVNLKPTWEEFLCFLEGRCFPRTRGHLKLVLEDLGLDSYDVFAIIEETGGRMADDHQWFRIYHLAEQQS